MDGLITGWAHTRFGKLEGETVESLIVTVAREAIAHAGLEPAAIDEIVLGHFNAGFSAQDFTAALVLQPMMRCASGRRRGWKMPVPRGRRRCIRD